MNKKDIKKILKLKKMINTMESIFKKTKNWESDSQIKNTYKVNTNNTNNYNNSILQNQIRQLNYIIQVNHLNYINHLNNINQNNSTKSNKYILELEKQKSELERQKNVIEQKKSELERQNNDIEQKKSELERHNSELEKQTKNCKNDKLCETYKSEFYKSVNFNKEILDILKNK